jgi:outer membrane receptor protein involved in Fe transport
MNVFLFQYCLIFNVKFSHILIQMSRIQLKYLVFILTLFFTNFNLAQTNLGTFRGQITDKEGNPLPFANVILIENNTGSASDKNGNFRIVSRPGEYTVSISYIGYKKHSEKITVVANRTLERNYTLIKQSFEIGGIEVIADNEFIPIGPATKTKVTAGEIEHIQASSLNDVMELTPGVETTNPTLNNVEQARIRGGDALGTQIVLDGVPITNNANLQIGVGNSQANSGVDLRSIPAENIKEVEIIRGIPSAQFGDLIDGLLIVKTRAVPHAPRIKTKYNPNVYEMNLSGGVKYGNWVLNGNFNVASSQRDVRIEGDGYTRFAGQLTAQTGSDQFDFKNIFYITRAFDERKEQPGYAERTAWNNKDLNFKYTGNLDYVFGGLSEISAKFSISYTNQDSYEQRLISRDNLVVSNRIDEGTQEGVIVFGTYLGQKWIKGDVWNFYSDINYKFRFFTNEYLHTWLAGATWRNDVNNGEGIIFDPLFPPSLGVTSPRIRTYSEIPAYNILSLYLEDKITGRMLRPFTLQVGFRYEVFRPNGFNISGLWGDGDLIESFNGSFLNPRFNFSYKLFDDTQIRASYGRTSKSPPMGMIFAQDNYFDVVDTVSVVDPTQPDSNFSLISTYIRQEANPSLKAYQQSKYEISLDQQFDFGGISVTAYLNDTKNMFRAFSQPTAIFKKSFPDWPDISTAFPKDTLLNKSNIYTNDGWLKSKGIEVTFKTRRIPSINTVFKIDAAYIYRESGSQNGYFFESARFVNDLGFEVMPMYNSHINIDKDLLINYRIELQAQSLGMWFTFHVQQKVIDIDIRENYDDTLAIGYYSQQNELVRLSESERSNPVYSQLRRNVEPFQLNDEDIPVRWLFNFKVSKSLWKGAAISFFVNNFLNNRPLYASNRTSTSFPTYSRLNPDIFYGMEFHTSLGDIK